jgi:putative tryptophan/tyrosine transport system substrate-binding protein
VRRVGVLMGIADDPEGQARIVVFRQALQALGWIEGRNVYRCGAGDPVQARPFAKELLDLRSDVILANSTPVAVGVRDITRTTPTVFVQVSDPVTAGVVQSLERPGGNLRRLIAVWMEKIRARPGRRRDEFGLTKVRSTQARIVAYSVPN